MTNPYFPHRKIRHAKLLTDAGFKIEMGWYRDADKPQRECNVTKLIYWKRGDIKIMLFDYNKISLKNLINRIEEQVKYNMKKNVRISFN